MRKILSVIIAAVIASVMMTIPVDADSTGIVINKESIEQSGDITIDYALDESYTVTIPASVTFTDEVRSVERSMWAEEVVLNEGRTLYVSVSSLNNFRMVNKDSYIDYYIKMNYATIPQGNDYDVIIVEAGEKAAWAILEFKTELVKDHAAYAGTYTDTLTFTVSIS